MALNVDLNYLILFKRKAKKTLATNEGQVIRLNNSL